MPYKPGLGQGHNQKKDTHTLDFDVTLVSQALAFVLDAVIGKFMGALMDTFWWFSRFENQVS